MTRHLLALAMLALALSAQAQQLRTLQVNVFRDDPSMAIGRVKGFFAAEGLDVKISPTPNSTEQMRGLSNGKFQIVSTAFDNVLAWSGREGAELIAVSQIIDTTVYPVFVRPEIKTWSDLRGKKLAVDAADTAFALVLRRVLLDKGLDLTRGDYTFDAVGATQFRLDSMKKGDTFAAVLTAPQDSQAIADGMIRLGDSRESLPNFPHTIFATNRAWAEKERAQMVGFIRAWLAATRWIRANRDEALKLVAAEIKVNPKVAMNMVEEIARTGALNPAALEMVLQLRNQFKLTPPMGPNISKYYDTQYYDSAAGR
jgi:ABC-type nitrate/sulfonate/bicarbonate transport system substrate-binding protein